MEDIHKSPLWTRDIQCSHPQSARTAVAIERAELELSTLDLVDVAVVCLLCGTYQRGIEWVS